MGSSLVSCGVYVYSVGIVSGSKLFNSCECCHGLCELICSSVVFCLENAISLKVFTIHGLTMFLNLFINLSMSF